VLRDRSGPPNVTMIEQSFETTLSLSHDGCESHPGMLHRLPHVLVVLYVDAPNQDHITVQGYLEQLN